MYKKIQKIAKVERYDVETGVYVVERDGTYYTCFEWGEIEDDPILDSYDGLPYLTQSILTANVWEQTTYVWERDKIIKTYKDISFEEPPMDKGYVCLYEEKMNTDLGYKTADNNIIDLRTGKKILQKNIPYAELFYSKGVIIGYNHRKNIVRLSDAGNIIWEYALSEELPDIFDEEGEEDYVKFFSGIVAGKLWVVTASYRMVVLDIETGALLKVFTTDEKETNECLEFIKYVGGFEMKEGDDDYLYLITYEKFFKFDAHKMEIVEEYKYKEGVLENYSMMYTKLQGDYFTFTDGDFHAGIYDYINRKLVWFEEIISVEERKKTGNRFMPRSRLDMAGNKLYIHDTLDNLHIYEKEESVILENVIC